MLTKRFFVALRHRNYPLFLLTTILGSSSVSLEMMLMGWFVLEFTDSPLLVAFIWNLLTVPFISGFMSVYARDILDVGAIGLGR